MQHWASRRLIDSLRLDELNWAHFWFPPKENEAHIRPGFYEELLKSWPEDLARRFIKGERVALYPGLPIFQKDFSERLHVRENLKPIPGLPLILCVDVQAWRLQLCSLRLITKGGGCGSMRSRPGYVDGRLAEQIGAKRFAAMCALLASERFPGFSFKPGWGDPYRLNTKSDTDEKSWAQYFRAEGFELSPGIELITDRIEGIRERLTTIIDGQPALTINKQGCPLSIEALSGGYRWGLDPLASRITGAEPVKDLFSHTMDAAGHAARKIFPIIRRHIPKEEPRRLPPSHMAV